MAEPSRMLADVPRPRRRVRSASRAHERLPQDEFGLDAEFRDRALGIGRFLYEKYWRVDARGMRNVPRRGPVILVSNHSGTIPFDAIMISCALEDGGYPRPARFLYDRFVDALPWIPDLYRKAGGVVATRENAERLLAADAVIGLFPEGVPGLAKLYSERYVLQPFSTGFVRLALRYGAPIVPVAVVGAEEIYPLMGRSAALGKLLGAPYLPVTPFFPLLGPLGMIPLPTKWSIRFGKPIVLDGRTVQGGRGAAHRRADGAAVRRMAEDTRRRVRRMVRALVRERETLF